MGIKFSRHAKRRLNLYKIPEAIILDILSSIEIRQSKHEIIKKVEGFLYPLKIVFVVEGKNVTVITNYPLKKGRKS